MEAPLLDLRAVEAAIASLSPDQQQEMARKASAVLAKPFLPNPGAQTAALESKADILLYGGQAGGGKTALEVGCAANNHSSALILRREATQLDGIIEFSREILTGHGEFVGGNENLWRLDNGARIKFAGCKQPDDWRKYAGNARDYLAFDEAGEFTREQVFSLIGWVRSTKVGQRCRVILGSNPPRGGDGLWMLEEFAPWLDDKFSRPANPGELRFAIAVEGKTEWVDGPGTYERNGEEYEALSRTFIPAGLDDNPYLRDTDYRARLQSLPEPLRSQLLYGNFLAGREDDENQVIPTDWIIQAQARWTPDGFKGSRMTSIAADVAQGGPDRTVISPRYGPWFAELVVEAGKDTPDGPSVAALVTRHRRDAAPVIIDVGGGYGGAAVSYLKDNEITAIGFLGANGSTAKTADGQLKFANKRAEAAWRLREALDPSQEGGSVVALPPDNELRADLAAMRWSLKARGILLDEKEETKKLLGRSPDKGDAVVMCWAEGQRAAARKLGTSMNGRTPQVVVGYSGAKRGRTRQ